MLIAKKLLTLQPFVVKLTSLAPGTTHFKWHAVAEFFESFGNSEILDADLEVTAEDVEFLSPKTDSVDKQTGFTKVDVNDELPDWLCTTK